MAVEHKFTEIVKPGTNIDFVGSKKLWIGASLFLLLASLALLPLNVYVIPGRGHMLNWGVDFKGGSEVTVNFSKSVAPGDVRAAVESAGFEGAEVIALGAAHGDKSYLIRMPAVSSLSGKQFETLKQKATQVGDAKVVEMQFSEGGDKLYVKLDKAVEPAAIVATLKEHGLSTVGSQPFGRPEEKTYEVTVVSLKEEMQKGLDAKLGAGAVQDIPKVQSVGAKAGEQLRKDGVKALVGAILLIVVYVAFRFDFRYGPGTVVALVHDAVITVGAFALTYKEFSLTTLAALLTIIGFSMNDTIVVFDRIRENAAKYRDRPFERVVNISINETLSRTILTSATVFFVTLAMNIFGTGVIRDFAFAMNVGVIVGTFSSIFIASPMLIWLNDRYVESQKKQPVSGRPARRPHRAGEGSAET